MNMCVHVLLFCVDMPSFLLGIYLGVEFLGHMETLFNLLRSCFEELLGYLRVLHHFTFSTVLCVRRRLQVSASLVILTFCLL